MKKLILIVLAVFGVLYLLDTSNKEDVKALDCNIYIHKDNMSAQAFTLKDQKEISILSGASNNITNDAENEKEIKLFIVSLILLIFVITINYISNKKLNKKQLKN